MPTRFVLEFRAAPGREADVVAAYAALRARLQQGVDGLLGHELVQSLDDPQEFIVTSLWESLDASSAWDRSSEHDALVGPLRQCFERAASKKYDVRDGVAG